MVCVGSSAAVSGVLVNSPTLTPQALRYAAACVLLVIGASLTGQRLVRPKGREWVWLLGVATAGLALFNIALVHGAKHAEPALLGVAVACVPLLLAVLGPLMDRRPPPPHVVAAAGLVTIGATLVVGSGRVDAIGLSWALIVLLSEAAFTLLAVPVLARLGAWSLSAYATGLAALLLAGFGGALEGPGALPTLTRADLLAVAYLGVVVTAGAFVLWYVAVGHLGAARAGLLSGLAPVAAAGTGVLLGQPLPAPAVWFGIAIVAAGIGLGFGLRRDR